MNKLLKKLIAIILLVLIMSADLVTPIYALSETQLSSQNTKTQNSNVEFNAYFEDGVHSKTENIEDTVKLYVNIKVENAGYLENAVIYFENVNFKINGEIENENVQSVDIKENKIIFNKINNGSNITIEIPVSILDTEEVSIDNFEKETITKFTATYIDTNGKEKEISKEITNKLVWTGEAESTLETELTKYIPYSINEKYGVMLQVKVKTGVQESKLPIKSTEINIQVPKINEINPTSVNVIATQTKATNGQTNGTEFNSQNYTYSEENGELKITTSNNQETISWLKNVQDEYLVNLIFEGKDIYDYVNSNDLETEAIINTIILTYGNDTAVAKTSKLEINQNEEKGTITDYSILASEYISKGPVYANYVATNKKETTYTIGYTAQINNIELTEQIKFIQEIDNFLTESETKNSTTVAGNNYAYNKNIVINQKIFQKILGEDGSIEIYNNINNEKIGTINKETAIVNENYVLDITEANTNQITIITSKPISEGKIEINIEKAIKGEIDYTKKQFEKFTQILAQVQVSSADTIEAKTVKINLKEPVSSAELSLNKTTLSTAVINNVEIISVLNTLNTDKALFKNPTIEIELPTQVQKVTINDINLLLENELKIKKYSVKTENKKQIIVVELQGEQTQYFSPENIDKENVIAKGANIIINVDLELDKYATTTEETINMYYTNEKSNLFETTLQSNARTTNTGIATTNVSMVSAEELVTSNKISGYTTEESVAETTENATLEVIIPTSSTEKEVTITGTITNNYKNSIENTVILGRVPYTQTTKIDETTDLENTFNVAMKNNITVNGIDTSKVKIYYSTNGNATKELSNEENKWTQTPSDLSLIKSYLINIEEELSQGTQISFSYTAQIPSNLTFNNNSSFGYKVYFDNITETATIGTTKTSGLIKLSTGENIQLTVDFTTNMEKTTCDVIKEDIITKDKETYYISNNLSSRFWVTIKNTSKSDANNVKVNVNLPENIKMILYDEYDDIQKELENPIIIQTIKAGETKIVEFELEPDINSIEDYNNEIEVNVEITADKLEGSVQSKEITFIVTDSKFKKLFNATNTYEGVTYSGNVSVTYETIIQPVDTMTNFKLHIPLPADAEIKNAYWVSYTEAKKTQANVIRETDEAIITLDVLNAKKVLIFEFVLKGMENNTYSTKVYAEADDVGIYYSNERFINTIKTEMSGEQVKTEKVYVKELEEFNYKFNIKTTGGIQDNFVLTDNLPEGIKYVDSIIEIEYLDRETYLNTKYVEYDKETNTVEIKISQLPGNCIVTITLKVKAILNADEKEGKEVTNHATISSKQISAIELNTITNYIEYVESEHIDPITGKIEDIDGTENTEQKNRYKITGVAWIDANKNGEKEDEEELLDNIKVMLVNKNSNEILKDVDSGTSKITTTSSKGEYEFTNIVPGEYLVVFLYDSAKYDVTEYQVENVGESYNSDAKSMKITLDGKETYAGVTDIIEITDGNARDIDIGLYISEKFDLKLEKYITKITLTTPTSGTKVNEYNNSQLEKIEILKQNVGKSNIVVEYKIVIKNEGQIPGYVKKVADYLPTDAKFNTEINQNWYKADNNNTVFNASLANIEIQPGESQEVTLILSYNITEQNIGTLINNNAEIYESYNKQGLEDMDSTPANMLNQEDDMSKADIILSVATGTIILNIGLATAIIVILIIGIYEIKKRVLKK